MIENKIESIKKNKGVKRRGRKSKSSAIPAKDFKEFLFRFYGGHGGQVKFAELAGLDPNTVARYANGVRPVPDHMAVLLNMMKLLKEQGLDLAEIGNEEVRDFSNINR